MDLNVQYVFNCVDCNLTSATCRKFKLPISREIFSEKVSIVSLIYENCFENPTVLHTIQSWSSDQNIPLSFHYFENPTVLHTIQS